MKSLILASAFASAVGLVGLATPAMAYDRGDYGDSYHYGYDRYDRHGHERGMFSRRGWEWNRGWYGDYHRGRHDYHHGWYGYDRDNYRY